MIYKTGDIFHCTGNGLIAKAIMKATKSKVSHSALFIEIWGKPYIIDAQKDGVNLRPFDEWVKMYNYKYVVHRYPNDFNRKEFALKAMTKIGNTAYDFEGLLIKQPIELLTGKYRRKGNEENKMYCSEYVAWCYGINESYRMSPEDLLQWCNKSKFIEI